MKCVLTKLERRIAATLLLALLAAAGPAAAQSEEEDLTELSLEELARTRVVTVDVLGGHIHRKGEWMFGYRYMMMDMDGSLDGSERLSDEEVLRSFPITPTQMTSEMHMFELMYGVSDDLTVMVMTPYFKKEMDHLTRAGGTFRTESEGLGDVQLMTHYAALHKGPHWLILLGSVSFPTGSIDEVDDTPAGPDQLLPYPMQLGTGSYRLLAGLTYLAQTEAWNAGFQLRGDTSLDENDRGYEVGDRYHLELWAQNRWSRAFGLTVRLHGQAWDEDGGADPRLNPTVVPTADPLLRGGERADFLVGLNFYSGGHRLNLEGGVPFYQSLDGPQLETRFILSLSWQWTF